MALAVCRPASSPVPCRAVALAALAILLGGCDSPRKAALRELGRRGIPATGASVVDAAARSDPATLELLLEAGVHPDLRDARGRTPLFAALDRGDLGVAFQLLAGGANPGLGLPDGTTPLSLAVARGELVAADRLLDAGAWPDGRMPDGDTLVPWSVRHGRTWVLDRALEAGSDPNQHDAAGDPLVHVAFDAGRDQLLDHLLERGADPSARDRDGRPLAHKALAAGRLGLALRLVQDGADVSARDADGQPLLHAAMAAGRRELVEELLERGADAATPAADGEPTAIAALRHGLRDLLPALRQAGVDIDAPGKDGRTPLARALDARQAEWTAALAALGADPGPRGWHGVYQRLIRDADRRGALALLAAGIPATGRDRAGRTLVEQAFDAGQPGLAAALLQYGAPSGRALWRACRRGDPDAARLLLDHGALPNPTDAPWLDTPLYAAVRSGRGTLCGLLLERGASPRAPGIEGQTALHLAAALASEQCVAQLLRHGADPNAEVRRPVRPAFLAQVRGGTMRWVLVNDSRVNPLMLAADSGCPGAVRQLLRHGARKESWTRVSQLWPIDFASRKGDVKTMRALLGKDPDKEQRRILIDLSDQTARVYDAAGNEIFATKVSTGRSGFRTPTGDYAITNKHRDWTSTLYHASMPYFQRLSCGDFGLHQGVVPGYPASHGCIRVPYGKASKLFELTELGDRVQIVP